MTFILLRQNDCGTLTLHGTVRAKSPEAAAANPKVGLHIKSSEDINGRKRYRLMSPPNKTGSAYRGQIQWFLEEVKPLIERPEELK